MATMIFRCPQDPEGCPTSPTLRSCEKHKVKLEPARVGTLAAEPHPESGLAAGGPAAAGGAGPRTVHQNPGGRRPAAVRRSRCGWSATCSW